MGKKETIADEHYCYIVALGKNKEKMLIAIDFNKGIDMKRIWTKSVTEARRFASKTAARYAVRFQYRFNVESGNYHLLKMGVNSEGMLELVDTEVIE